MKDLIKLKHLYQLKEAGVEYFEGFHSKDSNIKMPKELDGLELEYYKSFLVLTGKVLYSHSWLEMEV